MFNNILKDFWSKNLSERGVRSHQSYPLPSAQIHSLFFIFWTTKELLTGQAPESLDAETFNIFFQSFHLKEYLIGKKIFL